MPDPFFFGYGSLVNCATHDFEHPRPARVSGWRRKWRHTSLRKVAYLTVTQAPGHNIDGLIASVPNGDWAALDIREKAYDRLHLEDHHVSHTHPDQISVQMYKNKPGNDAPATVRHPILQSYLDTVVKGYLDVFGEAGVDRFFDTTDGWGAPVFNDRDAPVYPRHTPLAADILRLVDEKLSAAASLMPANTP